jgi:hypothetical protein
VQYVRTASEDHEQKLIKQGRPNAFVREPSPVKADWDALQNMHPKAMVCSMPLGVGRKMTAEETSAFGELISDLFYTHPRCEPVYLHIQKFHAAKLEIHLESGELEENFKCKIRKRVEETSRQDHHAVEQADVYCGPQGQPQAYSRDEGSATVLPCVHCVL